MYRQRRVGGETPQHTVTSLGTGEETQWESTLSYSHGNATVQMVFKESAREKYFPLGRICREMELEVAGVVRVQDKQDELKETLSNTQDKAKQINYI